MILWFWFMVVWCSRLQVFCFDSFFDFIKMFLVWLIVFWLVSLVCVFFRFWVSFENVWNWLIVILRIGFICLCFNLLIIQVDMLVLMVVLIDWLFVLLINMVIGCLIVWDIWNICFNWFWFGFFRFMIMMFGLMFVICWIRLFIW